MLRSAMAIAVLTSLAAATYCTASPTPGFSTGVEFHAVTLNGSVQVSCNVNWPGMTGPPGSPDFQNFPCTRTVLEPIDHDRFVAQADADTLLLSVKHEDGSSRSEKVSFDASQSRSDVMALWSPTLFDGPLLSSGVNKIHYQLTKQGALVKEGDVNINVTPETDRTCPSYNLIDPSGMSCQDPVTACESYFEQVNCR